MSSPTLHHCAAVSQNLRLAVSFARRFLDLLPEERAAVLAAPQSELIGPRMAWDLAQAICQARDLIRLLEEAEEAWIKAIAKRSNED
jgi:hypothetical protein